MPVYYSAAGERKEFARKAANLIRSDIAAKQNILIKPNLVSADPYPATTHPALLEELIRLLKECGKNIYVADGPSLERGENMLRKTRLFEVCRRHGVPLFHFRNFPKKTVPNSALRYPYRIYRLPFACDYQISLPVLKSHVLKSVKMSCALKNQFAFIANMDRLKLHLLNRINTAIADINTLIRPDFFIVDAVEVLLGANEKKYGGFAAKCGTLFCGSDPVALDGYGFVLLKNAGEKKLAGRSITDVPYIAEAEKRGLGSTSYMLEKI
ncbi:MAG TPA: DUF362 domain-containing protein [Desulfosalsimonadaceae bacterium]|nr:DUF362 domain-containing protein [Desulfosalsimonadaceae bacterium]